MDLAKRNDEMRGFFNEKANGYDAVHLPMMANKAAITEALPDGVTRVLDLGAGTGLELIPLFERFPEAHVRVIDISEEMLKGLRQREYAGTLEILCADFFAAEFGMGYDAVISSAALHHFDETEKARLYARIFACLKPDGWFINSDRCLDTREEQEQRFRDFRENGHSYRHYDTPLCAEAEMQLLRNAGFAGVSVRGLDERYKLITAHKPQE